MLIDVLLMTQRRPDGFAIRESERLAVVQLPMSTVYPPVGCPIIVGSRQCFDYVEGMPACRRFTVREWVLDAQPGAEYPVTLRVEEVK